MKGFLKENVSKKWRGYGEESWMKKKEEESEGRRQGPMLWLVSLSLSVVSPLTPPLLT